MAKLAEKWKNTDKDRVIEFLYLVVLGLYLLKLSFDTTMFYIQWPEDYEVILFIITCGIVMLKIGYSQKCQGLRWLFCVIMGVVFGLAWQHTGYNYLFLLYIPVLIAGAMDVDYRKILRVSFWINFATLALAFIGSCAGVIPDLSYEAEVGYRHSFGIVYTTDFAARVFYLLVIGWVLYDRVHVTVSLLMTAACTWFIWHYCQGKCSMITLVLFMAAIVYEYVTRNERLLKKMPIRIVDQFIVWLAPIGAGTIIYLSVIYNYNVKWISTLDEILTRRLLLANKAINTYGFSFLGTAFEQNGSGGNTAYNFFYNFIDSSYVLIILRYGIIVFTIFLMLIVYQSRSALKKNYRKLLLAIMLVVVHSIVEHHMPEVNYNTFLILPFVAFTPLNKTTKATVEKRKPNWKGIVTVAAVIGILLGIIPSAIRYIKTVVHLLNYNEYENNIYFILWSAIVVAAILIFTYTNIKIFMCRTHVKVGISKVMGLVIPVIVMFIIIFNSNKIFEKGMNEYAITINSEKQIIEKVIKTCGEDAVLYVADVPSLYKKEITEVSDKILPVETCDMAEEGIILITPIEKELNSLLQSGYYFGKLSDSHGIYTNNEKAVSILDSMGIMMTDYYSVLRKIDMQAMADANDLELIDGEKMLLSGRDVAIYHGPWIVMSRGKYIVEFDVQLINTDSETVGTARITSDSGGEWWAGGEIMLADFDESGHGIVRLDVEFEYDVSNTEFILIPNDGTELIVNSISYCKVSG